jgi:CP family cyanate transporter-like MFS transporter
MQDDLGVSHSVVGLVGTIPVLSMGLFAPLAGLASGRWGLRGAMAGCLLVVAAAGLGRAVAPGIVVLLALTLPIGVAMAIAGTLLPVAVKTRFAHRPAFATGIGVTGINIGAAVSSALAVPIAAAWEGWRGALAAFSLVTLAICVGWLALSRGAWEARSSVRPPPLPVRRPVAWFVVIAFALPSAVYYGLVAWIADVYVERGWSEASSGAVLAVMGIAAVPAGLVVPWLADRMGSRRAWMWFASGCLGLATFGFAALPGGAFAWAACAGLALGTVFPISLTMCLDIAGGPAQAGAAAALMFLAGYPIAALGPVAAGAVRDLTGTFDASLWTLFGIAVVMAAVLAPLTAARLRPEEA